MTDKPKDIVERLTPDELAAIFGTNGRGRWIIKYMAGSGHMYETRWFGWSAKWGAYKYETFNFSPHNPRAKIYGPFPKSVRNIINGTKVIRDYTRQEARELLCHMIDWVDYHVHSRHLMRRGEYDKEPVVKAILDAIAGEE
jgi:hypothetical protein